MPIIPPMLATRLADPRRLTDPRYAASPKLDGQRAQVHVATGRTVACYSRPGLDLLRHPGMAWLRELTWPVGDAVLDGEAVAGDGHEGIQAVFTARGRADGLMAFVGFDLLRLDGQPVMAEPWQQRRKRLDDLFEGQQFDRVAIVPVSDDPVALWDLWVGAGGEGIVLKDRQSLYRPGERSPTWLKLKPKLTLEAEITGGSETRIAWGDLGEAVMLALRYTHPRTGKPWRSARPSESRAISRSCSRWVGASSSCAGALCRAGCFGIPYCFADPFLPEHSQHHVPQTPPDWRQRRLLNSVGLLGALALSSSSEPRNAFSVP